MRMKENLFKKYSNEEIAQLIYDEFVSDKTLTENNVRKNIREKYVPRQNDYDT